MIAVIDGFLAGTRQRVSVEDVCKQWLGSGTPVNLTIIGLKGESWTIGLTTTTTGFGGQRPWFVCPCGTRCRYIYVDVPRPACGRCSGIRYPTSDHRGVLWWERWGKFAYRLARVRRYLERRYLRLARRGELERLEDGFAGELQRGLVVDIGAGRVTGYDNPGVA